MTIDALPSAPLPTDSAATFNSKAFALVAALNTFVTETNALETNVNAKEASTNAAAVVAASAAASAVAAANFKGEWSTLTGALNIPASVSHGGVVWVLNNNLTDVTATTPGVSSSWLSATFSTGKAIAMSIVFGV